MTTMTTIVRTTNRLGLALLEQRTSGACCAWCGKPAHKVFGYGRQDDNGKWTAFDWDAREFCGVHCRDAYYAADDPNILNRSER